MQRAPIKDIRSNIFIHLYELSSLLFNKMKGTFAIVLCLFIIVSFNSSSESFKDLRSNLVYYAQNFYSSVTYPIIFANNTYVSILNYAEAMIYNRELITENQDLKQEIDKLKIEASENKKLRKLLHMTDASLSEEMTVRVIANASDPHIKTFTINAGSDQNIEVGQVLINQHGLIGKVIDVTRNISKVLSVTDVNFKIPVIFSQSRAQSIVSGMAFSDDKLLADLISLDEDIQEDEPVMTSGEGGVTPYGIMVGYAHKENDKVIIKSSVNWDDLEYAQVLKKAN